MLLRCQRFPQAVEISDDHWCGEYRVRPEVPLEQRSEPPEEKADG
jgi:hypothetical protein